ncbi:MAG: hypothetical protein LBR21_03640 [Propionibacteriaceae bacterium]|jgi:hypothetical protein|nr:hypothetical protein [Propionibacteriaceae bacterium]
MNEQQLPPPPPSNWTPPPWPEPSSDDYLITTSGAPKTYKSKETAEPTISVDDFTPPKPKLPWIIGIAFVLIIALLWFASTQQWLPGTNPPTPTPSATETPSWGSAFEADGGGAAGIWNIENYEWGADGLDVEIRLECTSGAFAFSFYALPNTIASASIRPDVTSKSPEFSPYSLRAGQEGSGWVHFTVERQDINITLFENGVGQTATLPVEG